MKVFVIKVKENCYWLGGFYGKNNYDDIAHAKVYHLKSQADKQCKLINETYNYNAQVVEITIAEGDLEQQLAEKDKEIEELKGKPIIETDRETGTMKIDNVKFTSEQVKVLSRFLVAFEKKTYKQVCDEIRDKAEAFGSGVTGQLGYIVTTPLLDQIEKGEEE